MQKNLPIPATTWADVAYLWAMMLPFTLAGIAVVAAVCLELIRAF